MRVVADSRLDALQPLRDALLSRAHGAADQVRAAAETDGRKVLSDADKEAAALLADARAHGEAEAAALMQVERVTARRAGRRLVLEAQRAAYDELCQRARDDVRVLLEDPARRARLAAAVRVRLGEDADVRDQPDGGIVARTPGGRRVDASVAALVDRAVGDLDLEQLWTAE